MSSSTVDDKEPTSSPGKAEAEEAEPIAEDNDDLNEENERGRAYKRGGMVMMVRSFIDNITTLVPY